MVENSQICYSGTMAVLATSELTFWKRRFRSFRRPRAVAKLQTTREIEQSGEPTLPSVVNQKEPTEVPPPERPDSYARQLSVRPQQDLPPQKTQVSTPSSDWNHLSAILSTLPQYLGFNPASKKQRYQIRMLAMLLAGLLFLCDAATGGIAVLLFGLLSTGEKRP
jgi:hypothetical protein